MLALDAGGALLENPQQPHVLEAGEPAREAQGRVHGEGSDEDDVAHHAQPNPICEAGAGQAAVVRKAAAMGWVYTRDWDRALSQGLTELDDSLAARGGLDHPLQLPRLSHHPP